MLVVAGLTLRLTREHLAEALDERLAAVATSFRDGPARRVADPAALAAAARDWLATQPRAGDEVIAVRTAGGQVLSTGGGLDLARMDGAYRMLSGAGGPRWWNVDGEQHGIRALTVPLVLTGDGDVDSQPAGTLLAAASRAGVEDTLGHLLSAIVWASAAGVVFALAVAFVSVRRTLGPLRRLAAEIDSIRPTGVLPERLPLDTPADEVGRVADAFDRLLARVEDAFATQRRFVSDASHELRTPLTVARGQLELVEALDDPEARRSVNLALEELDRIRAVVEELLLLARLDEGLPLQCEPVEVDLVLEEAAMRGMTLGGGVVRVEAEGGVWARADADRLLQVVSNLVGNALRHGGEGVTVTLAARSGAAGDTVEVEVADTGPGIAAEDLPHVFDRFYRGSKARTGAPGGAGLGLAIVASLVEAMGGRVTVRSSPSGTAFTITLPAARRSEPHAGAPPPAPGSGAGGGIGSGAGRASGGQW